ncbi:MAG: putative Ig domain-containing protein [Verrucomicrobia bacterium]|nr:putative Ig domain-containing protein [Verrucomicrobiota bacterium]
MGKNRLQQQSLSSRAIGDGMSYSPAPLAFDGGQAVITNLAPREVAYFYVDVPANQPSWKLRLENTSGETSLYVRKDRVYTMRNYYASHASSAASIYDYPATTTALLGRTGDESYILTPEGGESTLRAGRYYIMVLSLGLNPTSEQVGSGTSSAVLRSMGNAPVTNLGTLPLAGPLELADGYAGGENKLYNFAVPAGVLALEVRLLNRVGAPTMALCAGTKFPYLGAYGMFASDWSPPSSSLITIANPGAGTYSMCIAEPGTSDPSAGTYTLRVRTLEAPMLNLSGLQNLNGLSNTATDFLADNQRAFFKIVVPADLNGASILGWNPTLSTTSGSAQFRLQKNGIPTDASSFTAWTSNRMVIVPPLLTPGTWYVEVKGIGATEFTLTSEVVSLERTWTMPALGQPITTPGLGGSLFFGDTGVDPTGSALSADQGVDLGNGLNHFYAIDVPPGNTGVLRTELQALNGNPNLYLRAGLLPTVDPTAYYDSALNGGTNTEYGNWVPSDGRSATQLNPGRWYLMVKAEGGTNCRYRLKLSAGNIQDLALDGGSFTGQTLAAGDWRYYRVQIPWDAPGNWNITYSQSVGAVYLYLRDTLPPGTNVEAGGKQTCHWTLDNKNQGSYPSYGSPGTYTVNTPQLRPGHTYYLGCYAGSDAAFAVSSAVSGGTIGDPPTVAFYGGIVTTSIPANSSLTWRVPVPADAVRWKHLCANTEAVQVYLEQGSLPTGTPSDDWYSASVNSALNQVLASTWPWVPGQSYYLTAKNTGAADASFTLTLDGRNAATDDSDNDGLPDAWERLYFANSLGYTGASDPDGDGSDNAAEWADGTNPNDPNSAKFTLTITSDHGTVTRSPALAKYDKGSTVTLSLVPDVGYSFTRWVGATVNQSTNPLTVTITGNVAVTALFISDWHLTIARNPDGTVALQVTGAADKGQIVIEASTNLKDWSVIHTVIPTADVIDFIDVEAVNLPQRYYRARVESLLFEENFDAATPGQSLGAAPLNWTISGGDVRVAAATHPGWTGNMVRGSDATGQWPTATFPVGGLPSSGVLKFSFDAWAFTQQYGAEISLTTNQTWNLRWQPWHNKPSGGNDQAIWTFVAGPGSFWISPDFFMREVTVRGAIFVDFNRLKTWGVLADGTTTVTTPEMTLPPGFQITGVSIYEDIRQAHVGADFDNLRLEFVPGASPFITTGSPLPPGVVSTAYRQALLATSGTSPYRWTLSAGTLPEGLELAADSGLLSGTPTAPGDASFTVCVTDQFGLTTSKDFTLRVTPSGGYAAWKVARFTPAELADPAISGDSADPDHDGIPNLLECALALEPQSVNAGGLPTVRNEGGHLTFIYRQNKDATDLTFTPQASANMVNGSWSAAGLTETGREDKGTYWLVTVTDSTPISAATGRFMRLQVAKPL